MFQQYLQEKAGHNSPSASPVHPSNPGQPGRCIECKKYNVSLGLKRRMSMHLAANSCLWSCLTPPASLNHTNCGMQIASQHEVPSVPHLCMMSGKVGRLRGSRTSMKCKRLAAPGHPSRAVSFCGDRRGCACRTFKDTEASSPSSKRIVPVSHT